MRRAKIGFVAVFFVLLLLPLLQMLRPMVKIRPLDEKRVLTPFPNIIARYAQGDGRISDPINQWFDDHVGFRLLFIRIKNQIDYSLFGYSSKVLIGRKGWLFVPGFIDGKIANARAGASKEAALRSQFVALAAYLSRRNIRLVLVSNPIKATVYPQFLPTDTPYFSTDDAFQNIRGFLKRETGWIYVDGEDVLADCKPYQLFYRQDIHITMPAAYCLAKEIVSRIAVAEGKPATFWDPKFTYHRVGGEYGGLVSFMSLLKDPTEVYDVADQFFRLGQPTPEGSFVDDPQHFFESIYRTSPAFRPDRLPPTVLYGNSFTDFYLSAGMPFQFQDLYRVRSNGIPVEDMLRRIPPGTRYVVVQFLEAYLMQFMTYNIPTN
jgi:hypothetical protein